MRGDNESVCIARDRRAGSGIAVTFVSREPAFAARMRAKAIETTPCGCSAVAATGWNRVTCRLVPAVALRIYFRADAPRSTSPRVRGEVASEASGW